MHGLALKVVSAASVLASFAAATPSNVLNQDFPDPAILNDPKSGNWYTFATNGNGKKVQVARSSSMTGPWTYLDVDPLTSAGPWAKNSDIWAPDVRYISSTDSFVLYYSAPLVGGTGHHCVGAATASSITGPYTPLANPLACPDSQGGAIDASGFYDDATGYRWLVYKVDGNSIGHGGNCNNGVEPIVPTPIMMQSLAADGVTLLGAPFQILDRSVYDGPLVEAPNLIRASDGTYVLFFSSNCYSSDLYDISYATASSAQGPYTKSSAPLLVTGNYGLTSPGGATSVVGGGQMVFHANCPSGRCMFQSSFAVKNNIVTLT